MRAELAGRRIVLLTKKDNTTSLITESGETIQVGGSHNDMKISPLAIAIKRQLLQKDLNNPSVRIFNNLSDPQLAVLWKDPNAFLLESHQKHIVIVIYDKDYDCYYVLGYLTSQSTSKHLSEYQFKLYQQAREMNKELTEMPKGKPQLFARSQNFYEVPTNQITFLKWGSEYLKEINMLEYFKTVQEALIKNPVIPYNPEGLPLSHLMKMIFECDNHLRNKIPFPKTESQLLNEDKIKKENEQLKEKNVKKNINENSTPNSNE